MQAPTECPQILTLPQLPQNPSRIPDGGRRELRVGEANDNLMPISVPRERDLDKNSTKRVLTPFRDRIGSGAIIGYRWSSDAQQRGEPGERAECQTTIGSTTNRGPNCSAN